MKTFVRLIRRYVLAAVGIVLLLVFLGLGLLVFLGWQETTHLPQCITVHIPPEAFYIRK